MAAAVDGVEAGAGIGAIAGLGVGDEATVPVGAALGLLAGLGVYGYHQLFQPSEPQQAASPPVSSVSAPAGPSLMTAADDLKDSWRLPGFTTVPPTLDDLIISTPGPAQTDIRDTILSTPVPQEPRLEDMILSTPRPGLLGDDGLNIPESFPLPEQVSLDDLILASTNKGDGKSSHLPVGEPTSVELPDKDEPVEYKSNPKHTPGAPGSNPRAGREPRNSLKLFEDSFPVEGKEEGGNKTTRFTVDENDEIHRFYGSVSNNGVEEYHWSGSTSDEFNPLDTSSFGKAEREALKKRGVNLGRKRR